MSYVSEEYYNNIFNGDEIDEYEFYPLRDRAEEIIEEMTMYRVNSTTIASMSEDTQERVRKAVCAQIEYLNANGGGDFDNGVDLQSAGLGKFNYSKPSDNSAQPLYAPRAQRLLIPTGLLYRGGL